MDIIFLSIQYCMTKQLFIFFMYCYFLVCTGTTAKNELLACLNIPGISTKSLKAREREVGKKLKKLQTRLLRNMQQRK